MARPIPVLINRSGGTATAMGENLASAVEEAFVATRREIDLLLLDGAEIAEAAKRYIGSPFIVVGGGDGTIGAAASALVHTSSALGILPLGTRNHFARQLGIPLDLDQAVGLTVSGQRRRIDIGLAGDHVFVNNASFGVYTRFVHLRDRVGGPKWIGSIPATWHALRHMKAQRFSLRVDGEQRELTSPLLFIGNNEYSIAFGHLGQRESLDDGRLSICAVSAQSPLQLLAFGARAIAGFARPERDFEEFGTAQRIMIEGDAHIEGVFDGEPAVMPLPLRLCSLPAALGVVTPREAGPGGNARASSKTHLHQSPHRSGY